MKKTGYTTICVLLGNLLIAPVVFADNASTNANASPMQMLATTNTAAVSSIPDTHGAIDCSYVVPQPVSQVSNDTVLQWANYAATQTFTYDFQNYDKQFQQLKACYTTMGWDSFMEAVKTSNNLKAAQEEHLFVSAKTNGETQLVSKSSNTTQPSWLVRVPVKVTYQNQDREVSQDMYVDLTIKTIYGSPMHLGINQIIASPKLVAPTSPNSQNMNTNTIVPAPAPTT